jgi:hypothetical protein
MQQSIRLEDDAHRGVAAGDQPPGALGKSRRKAVRLEALARRRLQQECRANLPHKLCDRLAPTSVVREFHDIRRRHGSDPAVSRPDGREQSRSGLRLDVARHQDARSRCMRDMQHQREVVVARGSISARRPKNADIERSDPQRVARGHRSQRHAPLRDAREERVDRGHALRARHERLVHHHIPHLAEPHDVEQSAEVIEIGVRHEHRPHPSARLRDRGHERA